MSTRHVRQQQWTPRVSRKLYVHKQKSQVQSSGDGGVWDGWCVWGGGGGEGGAIYYINKNDETQLNCQLLFLQYMQSFKMQVFKIHL